jgi:ubiquinone biosynthesis protein UbiJ
LPDGKRVIDLAAELTALREDNERLRARLAALEDAVTQESEVTSDE